MVTIILDGLNCENILNKYPKALEFVVDIKKHEDYKYITGEKKMDEMSLRMLYNIYNVPKDFPFEILVKANIYKSIMKPVTTNTIESLLHKEEDKIIVGGLINDIAKYIYSKGVFKQENYSSLLNVLYSDKSSFSYFNAADKEIDNYLYVLGITSPIINCPTKESKEVRDLDLSKISKKLSLDSVFEQYCHYKVANLINTNHINIISEKCLKSILDHKY